MTNNKNRTCFRKRILITIIAYNTSNIRETYQEEFSENMNTIIKGISTSENFIIGWDLNGHTIRNTTNYERVHKDFRYRDKVRKEETILDFTKLTIVNTCFKEMDDYLIIYKAS